MEYMRDEDQQRPAGETGKDQYICYIIGAGLGAASTYELPTSMGFLTRTIWKTDCSGNKVWCADPSIRVREPTARTLDFIEERFGKLAELDLEEVMSDLYVRAFGIGQSWQSGTELFSTYKQERYYYELIEYVVTRLRMKMVAEPCPLVQDLVRTIRPFDSIVTLNYDTLLEATFEERERLNGLNILPAPLGQRSDSVVRPFTGTGAFVKLHGSIDWSSCANEVCPNRAHIMRDDSGEKGRTAAIQRACDGCGWLPRPVIIPPIAGKVFDTFPKLGVMWRQAFVSLANARAWAFIGTSLARNDFHFAGLIRAASRENSALRSSEGRIYVVNSCKDVVSRVRSALDPLAREHYKNSTSLEHYPSIQDYIRAVRLK